MREEDGSETDGQTEEEEAKQTQEMKEERKEEELCVVLCNCHICEHQHGHRDETGDSYKKCSTPTQQAEHSRSKSKWRARWKVSTDLVEATSVRRAAATHCLPFYASRYEEVEKKRKEEGQEKRESCSLVKQQQ